MKGVRLKFAREWEVGDRIGGGGFGQVYETTGQDGESAAAKLVPKMAGAERELLFVDLSPDVRNVVRIIDRGEYEDQWVLVMPRAECSLRDRLDEVVTSFGIAEALNVLGDVADALTDLDQVGVVHRDLKPENVLLLDGRWCLADFGISRYAEATTAPDTQKFALSPPYAAPERWRSERATSAGDVYALGIMAFEMLVGSRPFEGDSMEAFREAHLHADPPRVSAAPSALAALVDECLYKAPEARPLPANLRARLDRISEAPASAGLARLQEANRSEVLRRSEVAREQSQAQTEAERREALRESAKRNYELIADAFVEAIQEAAPTVAASESGLGGWSLRLSRAELTISAVSPSTAEMPFFEILAVAEVNLKIPPDYYGYAGRSHSLWFGDVQTEGSYAWYETAFMISPLMGQQAPQDPFALGPGADAAGAVGPGMHTVQLAWPFTPLVVGDLDEFIGRWAGWLADAAEGRLSHPGGMPERPPEGSWRRG